MAGTVLVDLVDRLVEALHEVNRHLERAVLVPEAWRLGRREQHGGGLGAVDGDARLAQRRLQPSR